MSDPVTSAILRSATKAIGEGQILIPLSLSLLADPKFKGFTIKVAPWTNRAYDGKFHPSTHATWTERQLYYYLTDPEHLDDEQMTLNSVLAITAGNFWHLFWQRLWLRHGILQRAELPVHSEELNGTGHIDGLLANFEGLEIKTINDFQLPKIDSIDELKERKPDYYAQTQDYLAWSGLSAMRYFLMSTTVPFPMQEFVVPFDEEFQKAQAEKYRNVQLYAADRELPEQCCAIFSKQAKTCPTRLCCPVGRSSL